MCCVSEQNKKKRDPELNGKQQLPPSSYKVGALLDLDGFWGVGREKGGAHDEAVLGCTSRGGQCHWSSPWVQLGWVWVASLLTRTLQTLEVGWAEQRKSWCSLFRELFGTFGDRLVDSDFLFRNYLFSNSLYLMIIRRRPPGDLFTALSHPYPPKWTSVLKFRIGRRSYIKGALCIGGHGSKGWEPSGIPLIWSYKLNPYLNLFRYFSPGSLSQCPWFHFLLFQVTFFS